MLKNCPRREPDALGSWTGSLPTDRGIVVYRVHGLQGFIKGTYATEIGTILAAFVLLGEIAIGDSLTAVILIVSLGLLFHFKVNNPALVTACAVIAWWRFQY